MTGRPNVLIIMTDQHAASAMSCAGNMDLDTPAMDSLAKKGIRFENAYCTFPICSPSRASMLTGLMPHEAGVTENGIGLSDDVNRRSLGKLFRKAGYECVYGGKWHLPELSITDGACGFSSICGHNDIELADRIVEFLRKEHKQPFLLIASFDNPHNINQWARQQPLPWGDVLDALTADCPNLPANFSIPPFEPQFIRTEMAQFPGAYSAPDGVDDNWWRHYRHAYYRLIEKADADIWRILDELEATGLSESTLIIFTSDHGEGAGAHQWRKKRFLYEEAVRVPLIISYPKLYSGGRIDDKHLVSNGLDLLPTLCDFAKINAHDSLTGLSLVPILENPEGNSWRDQVISVTHGGRMVRTDRYKYVVYSWGWYREQLFDLENDPGEMVNLAVESKYREILIDHQRRLKDWINSTKDPFRQRKLPNSYEGITNGI